VADTDKNNTEQSEVTAAPAAGPEGARIRFDTANLKSSYANVCTLNSTREEIVFNFGANQAWEQAQNEVLIELSHRVILSPFAAMRLLGTLQTVMNDYQARYGALLPEAAANSKTTN
jgi:hypothetical protein